MTLPDTSGNPIDRLAVIDWPARLKLLSEQTKDPRLKAFYEAGTVAPETPISEVPMVALDFETTGLDPHTHSIVSIGLVPMSLSRIRCRDARHWVVRPPLPLHKGSITIHGITHSDINAAPDLSEVLDDLLTALAGKVVVVHHRGIERPFLDVALRWRLKEGIEFPVLDTMAIEAHLHPNRQPNWFGRLRGKAPLSIRLGDSRSRYGLPHYPPHHALTDALASAELLQAQIQYHFSPDTPIGDLWF
ncbi:3'-5' exonuclease [Marinobacter changyiensis]|uniref:3'-5' exonuclease n=1 Tax=Marinobacter changyiensis TaxID=2604091 RepID=UPI0012642C16|nr:3'-5' exonuclease [Marinobacter changyiensis]